ncbi:MAG: hypothetical protein JST04_06285 [Bdellovibrionales bacterium]|nr:hypothetical protein [Bdellovibrionales bacterium]
MRLLLLLLFFSPPTHADSLPYKFDYTGIGCTCTGYYDPRLVTEEKLKRIEEGLGAGNGIQKEPYRITDLLECPPSKQKKCIGEDDLRKTDKEIDLSKSKEFLDQAAGSIQHNHEALKAIENLWVPDALSKAKQVRLKNERFYAGVYEAQFKFYSNRDVGALVSKQVDVDPAVECDSILKRIREAINPFSSRLSRMVFYEWHNCLNQAFTRRNPNPNNFVSEAWPKLFIRTEGCDAPCD